MKRMTIVVLGVVVGMTAGCRDMGLDDNIPLEEARERAPRPLVAAVMSPAETVSQPIIVDGRLWVPSGMPLTLQETDLRAVGSATGRTVHARRWDASPYDALYVREESARATSADGEAWIELLPVRGRSGPVPGGGRTTAAPGASAPAGEHGGH